MVIALGFIALYVLVVGALALAGRHSQARALAGFIPDCVVLLRRLLAEDRVPRGRKAVLVGLIAYLASPIDIVPDFIPIAGQLDDGIVVGLALRWTLRGDPSLIAEHWPGPPESLAVVLRASGARSPQP